MLLLLYVIVVVCCFGEENMASFEVDLILREAEIGEEVEFVVCYNPAGTCG